MPQPPSLNLPKPVSDLTATRTGNQVTLSWNVPVETTDGATFKHRGPTKICRAMDQPRVDRCDAVATLETAASHKTESIANDLPSDGSGPNNYVTYAVEIDNDRGKSAGLSNQVQVPAAAVSKLNGVPTIRVTADAVLVTSNVSPAGLAVSQSIELRRTEKGAAQENTAAHRLLELPSAEAVNLELRDEDFTWEKTYRYRVVIVGSAKMPNGQTVTFDAATSAPLEIVLHDVFAPAVPTGVQAVFSGQFAGQQPSIDLTWNPDTDRDLAGYFVYRRKQDEPVSAAVKLNQQPATAPAYRDTSIQLGSAYVYSVSAIDERGNESRRSQETSEQVPK